MLSIALSDILNIAKGNKTKGGANLNRDQIGQRLRELRGERTIQTVANETGLGWSTICMYELGRRIPDDDNKIILANYYNKTVQELFFDSDIAYGNST